jgi:hypothetical protein
MPKIISIHRDTELALPDTFTVGMVPSIDGAVVEHNPVVKSIRYLEAGVSGVYNGRNGAGAYLVEFAESNVTRLIPGDSVEEVAYETEGSSQKKGKKAAAAVVEAEAGATE